LVDVAAELVEEGGPPAVTLREVGRRAGVSHNAPYKHFASKEELLAAVAVRELQRPQRPSTRAPQSGIERVRWLVHGYVRHALKYPNLFKLTYGPWTIENDELTDAANQARGTLIDAAVQAQQAKDLPAGDPDRLTALLLAVAHGAADLALSGHLAETGKGHADPLQLVDDLLDYLAAATKKRPTT
jgi:AcrR family transcriptional regulator